MDQSARTSAGHLSNLDRASGRLTSTLSRVGKAAVGAAAGYVGLSAAKNAISATSDLAKTTLSLNRNMGFSIKTASELGANLKIRGSDAKAAQMAFATFAGVLHQAGDGSASAAAKLQELGISGKRLKSDLKDPQQALFDVSDGLKNLGAGIKRTDDTRKLFGRGWSALSPILRGGSADLKKNLDLADQMGASFSNLGIHSMQQFIDAQHQAQLGMLGLQIGFTQTLGPVLTGAMQQFSNLAKAIHQKGFVTAVSDAISSAANKAGQMAPKILEALAKGMLHASIGGDLALSAILIGKFGGTKAFLGLGKLAGIQLLKGMAATRIGAEILSFFPSAATLTAKGEASGVAYGKGVTIGFGTGLTAGVAALAVSFVYLFNKYVGGAIAKGLPQFNPFSQGWIQRQFNLTAQAIKSIDFGKLGSSVATDFQGGFGGLFKHFGGEVRDKIASPFRDAGDFILKKMGDVFGWLKGIPGTIKSAFSKVGDFISSPFQAAVSAITGFVNTIIDIIDVLPGVNIAHVGGGGGKGNANKPGSKGGSETSQPKGAQRGGFMVPGQGSGDTVPALLEPGEYVLNREAVAAIGASNLDRTNRAIPRFNLGGVVGSIAGGPGAAANAIGQAAGNAIGGGGFNLPGVGSLPSWIQPVGSFVLDKVGGFIRSKLSGPFTGHRGGVGGTTMWGGTPIASWIAPELKWAQTQGWHGSVISGYRSFAEQAALYARYLAGGNLAAPPGSSEHESTAYPGGAVDLSDNVTMEGLVRRYKGAQNLKWFGPGDPSHFSGTGHMLGGLIKRFQGGGFMPPAPNASRYDSFYGFDSWAEPKDYPHQLSVGSWKGLLAHYAKAVGLDPGKLVSLRGNPKKDPRAWFSKWRIARPPYQKGGLIRRYASGGGVSPSHPAHGTHWLSVPNPVNANQGATLLWQAGMSMGDASKLSSVLPDESSGRWTARNPISGATGIWQILGSVYPGNLTNPVINSINAAIKWRTQGSGAWPTYPGSGPHGRIMQAAVAGGTTAAVTTPKTGKTSTAAPSALSGSALADVNADAINAFLIANGVMPPAPTIDPSTGEATGSGTVGPDFIQSAQDAIDSYNSDVLGPYNDWVNSMNDLLTGADTEALQRYQVGASQSAVLGISGPSTPTLYDKYQLSPLLDVNSTAGQAYLQSMGLLAPQNIISTSPYGQSITIGGGSNYVTGSSLTAIKQRGGLISYDNGGVVPGPVGAPQMAVVHGGEEITPPGHGGSHVHLHFKPGTEWLRDFVDVRVEKELKQKSRRGRRKLPSAGA